ncbi:unnamed protein product [Prunus armeniaca]|uniref:Uncharacterized protein n=1 Tax=Prunus armeniaca TaxID=36596 RepID=A0A6J5UAA9_PRUAR|nr:unnamed protein product [Prunus armeniaca]
MPKDLQLSCRGEEAGSSEVGSISTTIFFNRCIDEAGAIEVRVLLCFVYVVTAKSNDVLLSLRIFRQDTILVLGMSTRWCFRRCLTGFSWMITLALLSEQLQTLKAMLTRAIARKERSS